jgi:hypothetical protein
MAGSRQEEIMVELHQRVNVNGKPWEVVELDSPPGIVQLKLVGGSMKKRLPLEKVQQALHAAGGFRQASRSPSPPSPSANGAGKWSAAGARGLRVPADQFQTLGAPNWLGA